MNDSTVSNLSQSAPLTISGLLDAYRSAELDVKAFLTEKLQQVREDEFNSWISVISYALYPKRELVPKKVTAFVGFLCDALMDV